MPADIGENRVFLFLQGPHGPFFHRLGRMLRLAGAEVWRVGFGEQKINPAILPVFHFGLHGFIVSDVGNFLRHERRPERAIGNRCVHTGEMPVFMIDQPPAKFQLFLWVVIWFQPNPHSFVLQTHHGARIGAMGGDFTPILQTRIGKEAFVAFDKRGGDKVCGKFHAFA